MYYHCGYYPTNWTRVVCCYCEGDYPLNTRVCPSCHEYKGIMTIEDFEANYGPLSDQSAKV